MIKTPAQHFPITSYKLFFHVAACQKMAVFSKYLFKLIG